MSLSARYKIYVDLVIIPRDREGKEATLVLTSKFIK